MILNDPLGRPATAAIGGKATLDDLFRRAAARRPQAIALIDPPNRASFTDGEPRALTYAEADRAIAAIAGRLRRIGLHSDAIVGLQLAQNVESVLTLLAVLRAGMIPMPLPLLWRQADATAGMGRVGAQALIVSGCVGGHDQYAMALQVAAEVFSIRYVCGFGPDVPDGVIPLDDVLAAETLDPIPPLELERLLPPGPAAHLAIVTWDVSADGLIPVARSHAELVAGGLAVLLEGRFRQDATILTTLAMSSFAGLATSLLPWLLVGGTLALHHPFDPSTFLAQQRSMALDVMVLPGPMVAQFAEVGYLTAGAGIGSLIGVWRAPERLSRAPAWEDSTTGMIDVQVFGEIGLIAARRGANGRPLVIPFGPVVVPRGSSSNTVIVGEVRYSANRTVSMRGPMVPRCPFPSGVERTTLPQLKVIANGFIDTGYACWNDRGDNAALVVTGPPSGMIGVGGYRFAVRDLQDMVGAIDADATLAALPDSLGGHRLAGAAPNPAMLQEVLTGQGLNPLLVDAFRLRKLRAANPTQNG